MGQREVERDPDSRLALDHEICSAKMQRKRRITSSPLALSTGPCSKGSAMTSPRSSILVVVLGGCIGLASADEPKLERYLPPSHVVNSMALSADGKLLATGSGSKTAMLWDVLRGKQVRTFSGHSG